MPNKTINYSLIKPTLNETADIEVINNNMDILDKVIKEVDNKTSDIKVPVKTVNNKTGDVNGNVDLKAADLKASDGKTLEQVKLDTTSLLGEKAISKKITSGDFNNIKTPGLYTMNNCATNSPEGTYNSLLVMNSTSENYGQQLAINETSGRIYTRKWNNTTWTSWVEVPSGNMQNLKTTSKDLVGAINELFTNASDGKKKIATAITGKGVTTSSDATFDTMANNIKNIKTGYEVGEVLQLQQLEEIYDNNTPKKIWEVDAGYDIITMQYVGGEVYMQLWTGSNSILIKVGDNGNITRNPFNGGLEYDSWGTFYIDSAKNLYIAVPNDQAWSGSSNSGHVKGSIVKIGSSISYNIHSDEVSDIIVDIKDNIYTTSDDRTVKKTDKYGNTIWSYALDSQEYARGVYLDSLSNVYVVTSKRFIKLDNNGVLKWTKNTTAYRTRVYIDNEDNIYLNLSNKTLTKLDGGGNQIWSFVEFPNEITSVRGDNKGNIYVGREHANVMRLNKDGKQIWDFKVVDSISRIGVLPDSYGNVYVSWNKKIFKIQSHGAVVGYKIIK